MIISSLCSCDLTGPTPSSGSSTPVIQTANLTNQNAPATSNTPTTTTNQNVLPATISSDDAAVDHMINKNVTIDTTSDNKGMTRQGAVAVDATVMSRKGPPPVPTRASSTALTDEQRQQQLQHQRTIVPGPSDGSHDTSAVVAKVPPKVAKKPKANKRPPQPQASTGNHGYFGQKVNHVMY